MSETPLYGTPPEPERQPVPASAPQQPTPSRKAELRCPLCDGRAFDSEQGRMQSAYGFSSHLLDLRICTACSHVLVFYSKSGSSFFN